MATRVAADYGGWLGERIGEYATAVIVGGDGSLGVAYTVAAGHRDLTLGWIPGGFGNATAHLLGMPRDPDAAVEILVRGEARPIDLVAIGDRLALFAGAGWDALVAGRYAAADTRGIRGWGAAVARSVPDLWRRDARGGHGRRLDGAPGTSRAGRRQHDAVLRARPAGESGCPAGCGPAVAARLRRSRAEPRARGGTLGCPRNPARATRRRHLGHDPRARRGHCPAPGRWRSPRRGAGLEPRGSTPGGEAHRPLELDPADGVEGSECGATEPLRA